MPNPLVWDGQRNWGLDLNLDTPDVLLLREHITLISDLAKDWSGGTGSDFRHFVPMHYSFRVCLVRYAFHFFINDFNIVDVPRSRDHNAFMDVSGPRMDSYVAVDSTRFRPEFSVVPFTIEAKDVIVSLSLPTWDTHRTFGEPSVEVGKIGDFLVSGSYRYYAKPMPDHTEKLKLHLGGEKVAFKALGWVVRRMFCVKDNYFGNFTQFSTMQEYLEKFDHSPDSVGDPVEQKYRPGRVSRGSAGKEAHHSLTPSPSISLWTCEIRSLSCLTRSTGVTEVSPSPSTYSSSTSRLISTKWVSCMQFTPLTGRHVPRRGPYLCRSLRESGRGIRRDLRTPD